MIILSIHPDNRLDVRSVGWIPPILRCLKSTSIEVRRSAVGTLINLIVNAKNKDVIRDDGWLSIVLQMTGEEMDDEAGRFAVRSISNLLLNDVNRLALRSSRAVRVLLQCLVRVGVTEDRIMAQFSIRAMSHFIPADLVDDCT